MRFFASSHRLHQLSPRTRALSFLLVAFLLLQSATGAVLHHIGPGWTPSGIVAYYRGAAPAPADPLAPELPAIAVGKEFASLVDVAHMHLLFMALAVFLVAHLFAMTAPGQARAAGALGYLAFAGVALDVSGPFLLRYAPLPMLWAWWKLLGFALLFLCLWSMGLVVLAGLLRPAPQRAD